MFSQAKWIKATGRWAEHPEHCTLKAEVIIVTSFWWLRLRSPFSNLLSRWPCWLPLYQQPWCQLIPYHIIKPSLDNQCISANKAKMLPNTVRKWNMNKTPAFFTRIYHVRTSGTCILFLTRFAKMLSIFLITVPHSARSHQAVTWHNTIYRVWWHETPCDTM